MPKPSAIQLLCNISVMVAAATIICSSGCMRRLTLTEADLEKRVLEHQGGELRIRAYPSRRFVVHHDSDRIAGEEINADIEIKGRRTRLRTVHGRWTRGRIVALDKRNDRPRLWVAFNSSCNKKTCAYGFSSADNGKAFHLTDIPDNPIFESMTAYGYHLAVRRELEKGYLASLGEANQVYRGTSYRKKIVTVDLIVVERWQPKHRVRRRERGVPERDAEPREVINEIESKSD